MMRVVLAVSLALAFVLPCGAATPAAPATPAPDCAQTAITQPAMDACAARQAAAADRRLNAAYRDLMRYVGGDERAKLVAAERAWMAFRDADCAFFGAGDGTVAPMNAAYCRAALSDARAKELNGWPPNAPRDALVPLRP